MYWRLKQYSFPYPQQSVHSTAWNRCFFHLHSASVLRQYWTTAAEEMTAILRALLFSSLLQVEVHVCFSSLFSCIWRQWGSRERRHGRDVAHPPSRDLHLFILELITVANAYSHIRYTLQTHLFLHPFCHSPLSKGWCFYYLPSEKTLFCIKCASRINWHLSWVFASKQH